MFKLNVLDASRPAVLLTLLNLVLKSTSDRISVGLVLEKGEAALAGCHSQPRFSRKQKEAKVCPGWTNSVTSSTPWYVV